MASEPRTSLQGGNLFAEATHLRALRQMRLIKPADRGELVRRVLLISLVAWLPLAMLAPGGFFADIAVHSRMLVAVPLLVAADYLVLPRLEAIGRYLQASNLLAPSQGVAFAGVMNKARRVSAGNVTAIVLTVLVYTLTTILINVVPASAIPAWQRGAVGHGLSAAGWWHALVSLPILLGLMLGWIWRLMVWTWFLASTSRLGLCLLPSHPDRAGGLQFIAFSPRIFVPVVLAMATVVAGTLADRIFLAGESPIGHEVTPVATATILVLIFMAPPLVFTRALLVAWRNGVFLYGDLAARMGTRFEQKWLEARLDHGDNPLESSNFSATVDLYGVVANVYGMKLLLVEYPGLVLLAVAALLPFAPIWLYVVPLGRLAEHLLGALF